MIRWLKEFFLKRGAADDGNNAGSGDQAVLIHILAEDVQTDDPLADLATLEDELQELLQDVGEVDGHDIGSDDATVFVYGPSAQAILTIIRAHLLTGKLTSRARITLRFGPPGSPEEVVQLPNDR